MNLPRNVTDVDYSDPRFKFVVWSCLLGHPICWLMWRYTDSGYVDSAAIRFGTAFASLILLMVNHWPDALRKYCPILWHITLMFALPVIFTFTLLANNYSSLWLATHVSMLLLLLTAAQYARTFLLLLVPGTLIGIAWYQITINGDPLAHFPIEYIPVFLFVTVIGLAFLHLSTQNIIEIEKRALAEIERQKSSTLRSLAVSIAHEMRNPLSQIRGSLQLMQMQTPHLNSNKYIKNAHRVIQNGLQVIDITMDAIKENPVDVDSFRLLSARDLAEESVADFAYMKAEHANKVSVKGEDFKIMAEPMVVKYVLYNLIRNAMFYIKTLPDAEIVISVMPDIDEINQIEVRDTGLGIAPEAIPGLFNSFYTPDKQGGTGLGLAYCKRTMTALGGDIHCHSELGQYTAFVLSFPMPSALQILQWQEREWRQEEEEEPAPKVEKPPKPIEPASLAGKTVLIVEDERMTRMIIKGVLEKHSIRCLEAKNGREALDLLSDYDCDLILTDIQMPVMNGLELIQAVRQRERRANDTHIPIVALTSEGGDTVNAAIKLGINDYLSKSVSIERLIPKLRKLLVG